MRISDWSSDVFSSDLLVHSAVGAIDPVDGGAVADDGHRIGDAADLVELVGNDDRSDATCLQFQDQDQLDRKSVVKGKSVSVRVDLGGRRIINKKNNKEILHINHKK